ncbi:MAG: formate--tetrahydrofolate ligase [Actinobacteria bacterium]|uniref:formate--tetrahydrofolate ligase n=2 Tax=freshwater metagenome TaxID=449393 RepID=A0A6J6A1T2_9ZZZZ|nr:formate--tetrahydrofolate ligase [Actinomycetota bacterium]MSX92415.1 formate--tetrahydrofolate ligase [Actinomycetota bacterium]MSZ82451.1 formate--tetrahydrofolate ligase [Actinomycetota bacterium]MTB16370.1 formate--tetrahydrofolate ligase [Actinomycetota bacterium]
MSQGVTVSFPSDLAIARAGKTAPMAEIAAQMGIGPHLLEQHGDDVAKIRLEAIDELSSRPKAKYVVVTAITPTPLGEGKTTTTVGLGQAMQHIGKKAVISLRQPSMGPTFGIKGGAAGGGYSQVIPMELLNLHLTGDFHAVTAAHNLLAAMVDNHLHQGNALDLDLHNITWRRVLDVNDRALRNIIVGLGTKMDGIPRQTGFDITAASEVMAILALSNSMDDLRARMGRIVVGYNTAGEPVTAEQLKGAGSMAVIMREALKPNLLQTLENTPVIVHAGPFGNIAHGNSSIVGDLIGIRSGEYLITEAGFGADMGAERFFNIKCRNSGMVPDAAVLVATVRALKAHSGKFKIVAGRPLPPELLAENPDDVRAGAANLIKQIENVKVHGVSPVVAINAFPGDFASEHQAIREIAESVGARVAVCTNFADGGKGATELAQAVVEACDEPSTFRFCYESDMTLKQKIEAVATKIYGAANVTYSATANTQLARYEKNGFGHLPVCIAKTHLSISGDPTLKGAPTGHTLNVREARASVGAGFIYPICGDMTTMPGLGSAPAASIIDFDDNGEIVGLS